MSSGHFELYIIYIKFVYIQWLPAQLKKKEIRTQEAH